MSALTKILTGGAGLAAALAFASPASAQYYPSYPNYGNNQGVLGAIINGVIGGNQYGYGQYGYGQNSQYAVSQCARAVESRLNRGSYGGGYGGYGGYGYQNYGQGGRVLQVTRVERKSSGTRVRGIATSGRAYGYNGGQADLSFSCRVDYRGRITDLDLDRRNTGYGYNRGW